MFKVGDKVVCVKAGNGLNLIEGDIYTIKECFDDVTEEKAVTLVETSPPNSYGGYLTWRFRKTTDKFVDDLLERLTKEVEEEELTLI
jgi:hypothetical protein